jgi:predicted Zn-ribbon and HTH transcriptional regulator
MDFSNLFINLSGRPLESLTAAKAEPAAPATKDCPFCLSAVPLKATRCPHCISQLAAGAEKRS